MARYADGSGAGIAGIIPSIGILTPSQTSIRALLSARDYFLVWGPAKAVAMPNEISIPPET
jgi:hypothetical protein